MSVILLGITLLQFFSIFAQDYLLTTIRYGCGANTDTILVLGVFGKDLTNLV